MNNKLPVFAILSLAICLPFKHFQLLLKVSLPVVIASSIFTTLEFLKYESSSVALHLISAIAYIAFFISAAFTAIQCHRLFLLGPTTINDSWWPKSTGNEIKFIGWWLLIGLVVGLIAIPIVIFLMPFIGDIDSYGLLAVIFSIIIIAVPMYYFVGRWSMVLPSCALSIHGKDLTWSWNLSQGNGWRLAMIIGSIPLSSSILFSLLPSIDSLAYLLLMNLVWLLLAAMELAALSLSYNTLINFHSDSVEPPEPQ